MNQLTCPVCLRPEIADNICPNCETDLTLMRMLVELPTVQPQRFNWLFLIVVILCLSYLFAQLTF
jgi:hypothetical protein